VSIVDDFFFLVSSDFVFGLVDYSQLGIKVLDLLVQFADFLRHFRVLLDKLPLVMNDIFGIRNFFFELSYLCGLIARS
jgi:hypothetical protein